MASCPLGLGPEAEDCRIFSCPHWGATQWPSRDCTEGHLLVLYSEKETSLAGLLGEAESRPSFRLLSLPRGCSMSR